MVIVMSFTGDDVDGSRDGVSVLDQVEDEHRGTVWALDALTGACCWVYNSSSEFKAPALGAMGFIWVADYGGNRQFVTRI